MALSSMISCGHLIIPTRSALVVNERLTNPFAMDITVCVIR